MSSGIPCMTKITRSNVVINHAVRCCLSASKPICMYSIPSNPIHCRVVTLGHHLHAVHHPCHLTTLVLQPPINLLSPALSRHVVHNQPQATHSGSEHLTWANRHWLIGARRKRSYFMVVFFSVIQLAILYSLSYFGTGFPMILHCLKCRYLIPGVQFTGTRDIH